MGCTGTYMLRYILSLQVLIVFLETIMNKNTLLLPLVVLMVTTLAACTTPRIGGSDYNSRQVRGEQTVRIGTVESLRAVKIQSNEPSTVGVLGGAIAGAAVGHAIGQGGGNSAATVLGVLGGAVAGDAIQKSAMTQDGLEITIRLDSGYVIAVTQGADEAFRVGDRVQVLGGAGATRVTRLDAASRLNAPPPAQTPNTPPPPPSGAPSATPGSGADGQYLYFCPDNNQYYPAVQVCRSAWMKVQK